MSQAKLKVVNLNPSEYRFGNANTRIHTILGSCISITRWRPRLQECQTKLSGGGNVFPTLRQNDLRLDVSRNRIDFAEKLLQQTNLAVVAQSIGGNGCRKLNFDIASSDVWVMYNDHQTNLAETALGTK